MRVIKTILATALLVISVIALYKICSVIYIGDYLDSFGFKAIMRKLIDSSGYIWGNVALLGTYLLGLLNIWNKEL